jgi:hypothetical protein
MTRLAQSLRGLVSILRGILRVVTGVGESARRRAPFRLAVGSLVALAATVTALAGSAAPGAAPGDSAIALSRNPVPASDAWRSYVLGNDASVVRPVSVTATGNVTNPQALVTGSGQTTLTYLNPVDPPTIVLDYGREVGGLPFFDVASVTPPAPPLSITMRAGYTEVRQYLFNQAGQVAGDANGNNGVGTDGSRAENFTLTPASGGTRVGNAVNLVQGGERFEAIQLTSPGTVVLSGAGITLKHSNLGAGSYGGYFLSSDDTLNKIWFHGVYTAQVNAIPIAGVCSNATTCSQSSTILDGAKRDRRPWSGDLSVEGRTMFDSLGFGPGGSYFIRDAIGQFGSAPQTNGSVCGQISNWIAYPTSRVSCSFYSPTYSMYYGINLAEYYLYSADTQFAESQYQVLKNELAYDRTSWNSTTGLTTASGMDWDFYDGSKCGSGCATTATNMLYYADLTSAAWLAGQLAQQDPGNPNAATWSSDSATWAAQAASLKSAINSQLFDTSRGIYQLSSANNSTHPATAVPQDANSEAIVFGVAPPDKVSGILSYLKNNLWGTYGPQPFSADAMYSTIISPFITGFELDARFASGDTASALALTNLMWAQMVNTTGPFYTATLWEKLGMNGQITDSNASLAHGWATAPVSAFSSYLLGLQPTGLGYQTWRIAPQPGDLAWAQGQVPTPIGDPLVSRWERGQNSCSFHLTESAPAGTSGVVAIPLLGQSRVIARDGTLIWDGTQALNGSGATKVGDYVEVPQNAGAHTFAWDDCAPTAVTLHSFSAARTGARSVSLRWSTASETGVLGFSVWRFGHGKAVKVNRTPIAALGAGETRGASYRLLDRHAGPWPARYRLQALRVDGSRVWVGSASVAGR